MDSFKMTHFLCGISLILISVSGPCGGALMAEPAGETTVNPIYERIDFRYEDDMVDPALTCTERGYFAHPRNCTWFYRCDSSNTSIEFFRKDFFHCAPGTVFVQTNETLGFCVLTSDDTNCEDTSSTPPVVGDTTTVPFPPECNTNTCPPDVDGCVDSTNLCPEGTEGEQPMSMTLCESAKMNCPFCDPSESTPCGEGMWYRSPSIEGARMCFPNPDEIECCNDCYVSTSRCQRKNICIEGKLVMQTLCPNADKICDPCQNKNKICDPGKLYSMEAGICVFKEDIDKPCTASISTRVSPPRIDAVNRLDAVQCSGNEIVVKDQQKNKEVLQKYCKEYPFCSGFGSYLGTFEMCEVYFQCDFKVSEGIWMAKKQKCPKGKHFSLKNEVCLDVEGKICPK